MMKYVSKYFIALGIVLAMAIAATAQTFTSLVSFNGTNGDQSLANLVQGTDGNLYGTALYGGANGAGTVFKMTPTGMLTILYSFCSESGCADGDGLFAGLIQASDDNFYGTTTYGGLGGCGGLGCGTIFRITPGGTLTTLYSFSCSQSGCPDGSNPQAALIQATDGNVYGTTLGDVYFGHSSGTVFKITPEGVLTTLHTFCTQRSCPDGGYPEAPLVQANDGNFYGTSVRLL